MPPLPRTSPLVLGAAVAALATSATPLGAQATPPAPRVYYACYVPSTGTVYRINEPGLPTACGSSKKYGPHVPFSWTDGQGALRPGDAAGGDLAGTLPSPTVAKLRGTSVSSTAPTNGQVLKFDGTEWKPSTLTQFAGYTFESFTQFDNVQGGRTVTVTAGCLGGAKLISGGYRFPATPASEYMRVRDSHPAVSAIGQELDAWQVRVTNENPDVTSFGLVGVHVRCARPVTP